MTTKIGSGYFTTDGILPLEVILLVPFMCVYIAIIATILAVRLWLLNSATALKYNDYGLESTLEGHLNKGRVHWRGAQYVNIQGSVNWEGA